MTTAAPASTTAVAEELVQLCREGRNLDAIAKLYSPTILSIEPVGNETKPAEIRGIDAVREKNESWFDAFEVNSAEVQGPFIGEDQFAVRYDFDTTSKATVSGLAARRAAAGA